MSQLQENLCPRCSAPLHVGPSDLNVQCRYCGISVAVKQAAPPPPPVSAFNPHHHQPERVVIVMGPGYDDEPHFAPVVHVANTGQWIVWAVVSLVIALTAIPGALFGSGVFRRSTSLPATCGPNGTVVVDGKKLPDAHGVLVTASANCQVTLKHITAKTDGAIVEGGPNLKLVIEDSDLESGGRAFDVGTNATVTLRKTKIRAKEDGLKADSNLDFTCDACTITSGGTAIAGETNAKIKLSNQSDVQGTGDGVDVGMSGSVDLQNSKIAGALLGVRGGMSASVRLRAGSVIAGGTGFKGGNNAKIRLEGGSIEGKEIGVEADSVEFESQSGSVSGAKASLSLSRLSSRSSIDKLKLTGPVLVGGQPLDAPKPGASTTSASPPKPPTRAAPPPTAPKKKP